MYNFGVMTLTKNFVYPIQAEEEMPPYDGLSHEDNDIILLTWKNRSRNDCDSIYFPNSTWADGRNKLLRTSKQKGEYLYYIFMDDDCLLSENSEIGCQYLTGNPFRTFEKFLLDWEPALGYPYYDWHYAENRPVNLAYRFDAIVHAFHRDAVPALLPYCNYFDNQSWHFSQYFVILLSALIYNEYRIQCNSVSTTNLRHDRKYPSGPPLSFLHNRLVAACKDSSALPGNPMRTKPTGGVPKKKDIDYRIDISDFVDREFFRKQPLIC
jgi:hypothetical protein